MSMTEFSSPRSAEKMWFAVLACYWLAIFIGTHIPNNAPPVPNTYIDKVIHFFAFGVLAALLAKYADVKGIALSWRTWIALWSIIVAYGVFDERSQLLVGRGCELRDWLADGLGAACGLACYRFYRARRAPTLAA